MDKNGGLGSGAPKLLARGRARDAAWLVNVKES